MNPNWYKVENEAEILTPAMLLFPDRIKNNIDKMVKIAGSASRLRPHVKSHKLPQIVRMQMEAGINKFKCATISEAKMLAETGVKDVLIAYPLVGPALVRLMQLAGLFPKTKFSTLVDDLVVMQTLEKLAMNFEQQMTVFVDIDNGMHRTGINPEEAFELYRAINISEFLKPGGLHIYDGHIHDRDFQERKDHSDRDFEPVNKLINLIEIAGMSIPEIICGGNPSFPVHALYPERTLSPGTCLLWDYRYHSDYPDLDFQFGAIFTTRIVSKPQNKLLTLDAGHKAIASEMKGKRMHLFGIEDYELTVHSEEHQAIKLKDPETFFVGDLLYGVPYHICPTMALHEQVYVVENGKVVDKWRLAARSRIY